MNDSASRSCARCNGRKCQFLLLVRVSYERRYKSPAVDIQAEFAEALEFVEEGAAADAKGFGGFGAVKIVLFESGQNGLPFDFAETLRVGWQGHGLFGGRADFRWQMIGKDQLSQ